MRKQPHTSLQQVQRLPMSSAVGSNILAIQLLLVLWSASFGRAALMVVPTPPDTCYRRQPPLGLQHQPSWRRCGYATKQPAQQSSSSSSSSSFSRSTTTPLHLAVDAATSEDDDPSKQVGSNEVGAAGAGGGILRFLGAGERAIVRPGVVLVAPSHEFHHFYRKSAIFIYAMGQVDRFDATDTSGDYIIRGVIVDHPTVFTLAEMMEHQPTVVNNPLGNNLLFRGGDKGGDGVILLHTHPELTPTSTPIGDSGIYQGGWQDALRACAKGEAPVHHFKAFFNYCEFTEKELENMLAQKGGDDDDDEDDDVWMSLEVDPEIILDSAWDRGEAWTRLRNGVKQRMA